MWAVVINALVIGLVLGVGIAAALQWWSGRAWWSTSKRRVGEFHEDDDVEFNPHELVVRSHCYNSRVLMRGPLTIDDCVFVGCTISIEITHLHQVLMQLQRCECWRSIVIPVTVQKPSLLRRVLQLQS